MKFNKRFRDFINYFINLYNNKYNNDNKFVFDDKEFTDEFAYFYLILLTLCVMYDIINRMSPKPEFAIYIFVGILVFF